MGRPGSCEHSARQEEHCVARKGPLDRRGFLRQSRFAWPVAAPRPWWFNLMQLVNSE